ncbi:MAG TPA: MBL fold metallo-hydrolase [Longimicrobiales bacterium]|nr:MBL fold metallo-hydrolase [Longimicrobiales bacterium]
MQVRTFTGGGFGENAYLVLCDASGVSVVVDPGADAPSIARALAHERIELAAILLTHAHVDHVEGVEDIRRAAPEVPIWIHPDALPMYRAVAHQAARFGLALEEQPEPTDELAHGLRFEFGACALTVRSAPGHAPGHVVLVAEDHSFALVGDVVFQGSIGRTDLPGGDFATLMRSIREQVLTLPDRTVLYPGHGPPTTVGAERVGNPFLVPHYGGELA